MKVLRIFAPLLFLLALALGLHPLTAQIAPAAAPSPALPRITRTQADKDYAEKSYALALPAYQVLVQALPPKSPDRALLEYRVAVALGASQKWDDALAAWTAYLTAHAKEPLWTARAHYQRGLLLNLIPHQGYKIGTRIYRGSDYPHTTSSETPQYVWLQNDDMQAALSDFEQAVVDYDKASQVTLTVRLGHGEAKPGPIFLQIKNPGGGYQDKAGTEHRVFRATPDPLANEKTDLYFDLARTLQKEQAWGSEDDWKAAKKTDWTINTHLPYDPKWPQPKKVLYLLSRIPTLNPADSHIALLAELARGLYVAQAHNGWVRTEYVVPPGHPEKGHEQVAQSLPYFTLDPFAILTNAANFDPRDPQTPQIRLILAQWTDRAGDYPAALKLYRALVRRYPMSKWAPDARQGALEIQRPTVSVSTPGPQHVGSPASVSLSSRNLKTITLRAYQVPLENVLSAPGKLNDPANRLGNFPLNFGSIQDAQKLGLKVAE